MNTVVGVLRGGPSREHEVSLKTGHAIASNLSSDRYTVRDIYIDKNGQWYDRGRPVTPTQALRLMDVAIVALHGEYGEDGEVQKVLEAHNVPYTGSDPLASFIAMHKVLSKERAKEAGVLTPRYFFVEPGAEVEHIVAQAVRTLPQPMVIKPVRWGSSVGVSLVAGYAPALRAVQELLEDSGGVLIEERIRGKEATAGVVEGLRGEELYALPVIEIVPPTSANFFDYTAKYDGSTQEICPGRFSKEETAELYRLAKLMHETLGLRHYSRSDFIVNPRGIYFLETNTLPGMTEQSLLPRSLAAVGVKFADFLDHLVGLALKK